MAHATSQPRPHALAHALHRHAGFALLRPASKPELDGHRIVTMSGAIAINLLALGLLMMPLAMPQPVPWEEPKPREPIRDIYKEKPVEVDIVKTPVTPVPIVKPVKPQVLAPAQNTTSDIATVIETGTEQLTAEATSEETGPITDLGTSITAAPSAIQLEYLSAPAPKYPRGALMRRIEGTVMLQVLVGIDGRPLEVSVSQSSGNRELDEAARSQILKRWSFRPAMRNGQAVQAVGLVPVAFNLRD